MITELDLSRATQRALVKFYDGQHPEEALEIVLLQKMRASRILAMEIGNMATVCRVLDCQMSIAWAMLVGLDYLGKIEFRCNGGGWCYRVIDSTWVK